MTYFQKFDCFTEALAEQKHNLSTDTLKVYLTNVEPLSTMATKAALTEITDGSGTGYTAGGNTCTLVSSSQTGGTYKLVLNDPATWTSSSTIGPFRYAVLYNFSSLDKDLIGYWDYGSSLTLSTGETFRVDFNQTTGIFTIS